MTDLDRLLTPLETGPGRMAVEVPEGWAQGRGAFGGLVVGMMVRAAIHAEPEGDRLPRAVTSELAAPVEAGPAELLVEPFRRGSALSTVRVRWLQGGEERAQAVVVLGRDRADPPAWRAIEPPSPAPFERAVAVPFLEGVTPPFLRHLDLRPTLGIPYSGAADARSEGWVRALEPGARRDAAVVAFLADTWYSAGSVRFDRPRPFATSSFHLQVVEGLEGLPADAPVFLRVTTPVAAGGYLVELREVWAFADASAPDPSSARLVALNQQLLVVIK